MLSHPLPVLGKFEELIESKHRMVVTTFHVINGDGGSLLSYSTATELDIVKMNVHAVTQPSSTSYSLAMKIQKFLRAINLIHQKCHSLKTSIQQFLVALENLRVTKYTYTLKIMLNLLSKNPERYLFIPVNKQKIN